MVVHPESFGTCIRKARQMQEMTMRDLAAHADISQGYLSDIENHKCCNPSVRTFINLCFVLELDKCAVIELF